MRVELPGGTVITGIAEDVDPDGRLLLLDPAGHRRAVSAGDVVHLRPARPERASAPLALPWPMAYPDDLLVEGEQVVHAQTSALEDGRPARCWRCWSWSALASYLAALIGVRRPGRRGPGSRSACVGLVLIGWLTVVPVIRWRTTHFVVTTRRVLVREGVLTRHGIDIPMGRINSVQFRHNLIERMLGCGTLIIESASEEPLEFDDIPQVEQVHTLLYQEVAHETVTRRCR